MKNTPIYKFRGNWRWLPCKEDMLNSLLISPSLHVCNGSSKIGDITLDLHMPATVKGDMRHLPFKDLTFQSVLIDPPWHLANHLRPKMLWELRRVLKIGGRLILRAPWIPKIPKLNRVNVLVDEPKAFWVNADIYSIYERQIKDIPASHYRAGDPNQDVLDNHISRVQIPRNEI